MINFDLRWRTLSSVVDVEEWYASRVFLWFFPHQAKRRKLWKINGDQFLPFHLSTMGGENCYNPHQFNWINIRFCSWNQLREYQKMLVGFLMWNIGVDISSRGLFSFQISPFSFDFDLNWWNHRYRSPSNGFLIWFTFSRCKVKNEMKRVSISTESFFIMIYVISSKRLIYILCFNSLSYLYAGSLRKINE